jgi:hypothetical protein
LPEVCGKEIPSRSKFVGKRLCQREPGHNGVCVEFPFLREFNLQHPAVADKIKRDSIMTTGAAWKSADAGPNRILRWVMLMPDDELKQLGIDMANLKPQVQAKLRDKAASYDACMAVAKKLTWLAYQMPDAPEPGDELKKYLESDFGVMHAGSTKCIVCRLPVSFRLFELAVRGKAAIETGHSNPRAHNPENVGFVHRECNIAQGNKSLDEFYHWIKDIVRRIGD